MLSTFMFNAIIDIVGLRLHLIFCFIWFLDLLCFSIHHLLIFVALRTESGLSQLSASLNTFILRWAHQVAKLSSPSSNLWSSCLIFSECWEYKCISAPLIFNLKKFKHQTKDWHESLEQSTLNEHYFFYKLNVCVPLKYIFWGPKLKHNVIWRDTFWELIRL